jgi:hypothetical protein
MDPKDAAHHMKRCVDSGLWVPSAGDVFDSPDDSEQSPPDNLESTTKAEASKTEEESEKV